MIEPSSDGSEFSRGYQQALDDFGISQLRSKIRSYSDSDFDALRMQLKQKELNRLAAHLIEELVANLKGSLIASYLNTLRKAGDSSKPWAIVRILPNAQNHTVSRFCNPVCAIGNL
ncbi:MAG: hypothetical protein EAZ39_19990 [Oscillatoriales cyanobacterium]|nr:MAG: hypothetical protein EAZ39_19990 [Oscillatoriales cyanobacterium]